MDNLFIRGLYFEQDALNGWFVADDTAIVAVNDLILSDVAEAAV